MLSYRKSQQASLTEKLKKEERNSCSRGFWFGHNNGASLPQRIRAGCDGIFTRLPTTQTALPQRIRAGCDVADGVPATFEDLCHSAFVRVATPYTACSAASMCCFATAHSCGLRRKKYTQSQYQLSFATAHSCGLRLICARVVDNAAHFATAHSCGLRPASAAAAFARLVFATAHSRGLRRQQVLRNVRTLSLPQRIRAGCDQRSGKRWT